MQGSGVWRRFSSCNETIAQVIAYAFFTGTSYEDTFVPRSAEDSNDTSIVGTNDPSQIRSLLQIGRICCPRSS